MQKAFGCAAKRISQKELLFMRGRPPYAARIKIQLCSHNVFTRPCIFLYSPAFLDAIASLAFKLSVIQWLSELLFSGSSVFQSLQSIHSTLRVNFQAFFYTTSYFFIRPRIFYTALYFLVTAPYFFFTDIQYVSEYLN